MCIVMQFTWDKQVSVGNEFFFYLWGFGMAIIAVGDCVTLCGHH